MQCALLICAEAAHPFSSTQDPKFLFFLGMSSHIWSAGGILATLLSPLVPLVMGRARHLWGVGRIVRWVLPEEEGAQPDQEAVVTQVDMTGFTELQLVQIEAVLARVADRFLPRLNTVAELRTQNAELQAQVSELQSTVDRIQLMMAASVETQAPSQ